jgi:hypothetical protein
MPPDWGKVAKVETFDTAGEFLLRRCLGRRGHENGNGRVTSSGMWNPQLPGDRAQEVHRGCGDHVLELRLLQPDVA